MRIAMIIEAWKPIWGGGQAHVFELAKKLVASHDCQVDIFVMNLKDENGNTQQKITTLENGNLKIVRIGKIRNFYSFKDRIFWTYEVIKEIKSNHKKHPYNTIHAHANLPGIPGKILSKSLKIPVVYTVHGTNFLDLEKKNFFYFVEKILFTIFKYNAQISVSRSILNYTNKNTPFIIPNGVDIEKFSCPKLKDTNHNIFKLLFVGRLDKVKGINILLESVNKIKNQLSKKNVQIHLVGYGYDKNILKETTETLGLQNIVLFKGKKTGSHLIKEYCSSDLFILPSLSEGQPLTLLEAWAAKLPVIVTDVGDNKYFVKNKINGYIIPSQNSDILAKTILKAINNPNLKQMGVNGYNLVSKQYTWDNVANKTYAIYQKISQ